MFLYRERLGHISGTIGVSLSVGSYTQHTDHEHNHTQERYIIILRRGTHAQGTGCSIPTSRHSELLEVVDRSRCRKRIAV